MEHAISPEVEALLLKRFGDRETCPHGVPINGGVAQLRKQGASFFLTFAPTNPQKYCACMNKDDGSLIFWKILASARAQKSKFSSVSTTKP